MFGLIEWSEKSPGLEEESLLGLRFLVLRVKPGRRFEERFRLRRGARWFEKCGVEWAVFPKRFADGDIFARHHIFPPDIIPLHFAAAATAAKCAMDGRRVERVIFTGEHVDKNLTEAAVELSTGVRYLGLSIEHGGEGLAHLLRRNYGVAAQLFYKPEQVEPGDFILSFSEKGSWQNSAGQCLPLWDPSLKFRFRLPEALEIGTADEEQLIALLYAARALKKEQLEVVSIFRNDGEKE